MPVTQINHTGRKRLTSKDVAIGLYNEATPLAFEVARLSLDRHNLPDNALVRLEAYHNTICERFALGTVSELVLPSTQSIPQFNIPDGIRFRLKVTSVTEPGKGQLLAAGTGIAPSWLDGGQESLLPVKPDDTLGQEVYRLSFDDGIVLLINDRIEQWRELSRDPQFMALVYPSALKMILSRILLSHEQFEDDNEEDWPEQWIEFATGHLGIEEPPQLESEGTESVAQWIDQAVTTFCNKNRSYDNFSRRWNGGDTL